MNGLGPVRVPVAGARLITEWSHATSPNVIMLRPPVTDGLVWAPQSLGLHMMILSGFDSAAYETDNLHDTADTCK